MMHTPALIGILLLALVRSEGRNTGFIQCRTTVMDLGATKNANVTCTFVKSKCDEHAEGLALRLKRGDEELYLLRCPCPPSLASCVLKKNETSAAVSLYTNDTSVTVVMSLVTARDAGKYICELVPSEASVDTPNLQDACNLSLHAADTGEQHKESTTALLTTRHVVGNADYTPETRGTDKVKAEATTATTVASNNCKGDANITIAVLATSLVFITIGLSLPIWILRTKLKKKKIKRQEKKQQQQQQMADLQRENSCLVTEVKKLHADKVAVLLEVPDASNNSDLNNTHTPTNVVDERCPIAIQQLPISTEVVEHTGMMGQDTPIGYDVNPDQSVLGNSGTSSVRIDRPNQQADENDEDAIAVNDEDKNVKKRLLA